MSWLLLLRIRNFNQVVGEEDAFEQCRSLLALQQAAERLTLKRFVPALATNTYILLLFTAGPNSVKVLCDSVLTKAFEEETESDIIYFTFEVCLCYYSSVVSLLFDYLFGHAQKSVQKVNFFIFSSCSIFFKLPVKVFLLSMFLLKSIYEWW